MPQQIFVNMHVKDLDKSKTFFEKLGYSFNPQFTDANSGCLVISDTIFCMLLNTESINRFIPKGKSVADASKTTEVLLALSFDSKDAVNDIFEKAISGGATECRPTEDHGFMYSRSFNDLDGHIWEAFWFDPSALQQQA